MEDNFNHLNSEDNQNTERTPHNEENSTPNPGGSTLGNPQNYGSTNAPSSDENDGWNSPRQNGEEYRPPYYSETHRQSSRPQNELPPQQYSASGGWQQNSNQSRGKEPYQWKFEDYQQAQAASPKRRSKGLIVFSVILASVVVISLVSVAGVSIFNTIQGNRSSVSDTNEPSLNVPASELPGITLQDKPSNSEAPSPDGKLSTEQIVDEVEPSIVAITTYLNYGQYQAEGMGSGIVISDNGYIATNAHVVEGAIGITVTMSDGTTKYEGRVVGADTKTDLAVIKVEATGLSPASFGNSDQVKVGEKVIAIGNPQSMEFAGSVTQGIVSGLNRQLTASSGAGGSTTTYSKLIQTDAAINPGNSGGALVNEYGQVIGINSAKMISTGAEGMGFAIPSNEVKPIIDDLVKNGRVTGRAMLGITVYPVDISAARLNNVPIGLFVQSTMPESDISRAGIVPGDILTKADGVDLDSNQALSKVLEGKKPGDTIELEVFRPAARSGVSGKKFTATVKLIEDMGNTATNNQQPVPEVTDPNSGNKYNPGNDDSEYQDPYEEFEDFFNQFFG
ncbi:MAG: trypsin-like serine protease [Ruminococcaceae bacterium]|jgi:serine protease Do|nr:trypsin-like serine protease [Oscillospiraceae bacterium]